MSGPQLRTAATIAINEGVSLLEKLSPKRLNELRAAHPLLSDDLDLGIVAGAEEKPEGQSIHDVLLKEKAAVMIAALGEATNAAYAGLASVSRRVRTARRARLFSQVLVLIGSSSSLATLALSKNRAAVIAAVLTLLAALGNLLAEYQEKLLYPQTGNIYDVLQKLGEGAYRAKTLSTELTLAVKYDADPTDLKGLVANANMLCEQLNGWLIQILNRIQAPAR
jgi:hypothetical protein